MERDSSYQDDLLIIDKSPVQFYRNAVGCFTKTNKLRDVPRAVVKRLYPLGYEGCYDRSFFIVGYAAVDAGRKDDIYVERGRSVSYKPSNHDVYHLSAGDLACRIRHDDEDFFAGLDELFDRGRTDGLVELFSNLEVGQRVFRFPGLEDPEPLIIKLEKKVRIPVFEFGGCHSIDQCLQPLANFDLTDGSKHFVPVSQM